MSYWALQHDQQKYFQLVNISIACRQTNHDPVDQYLEPLGAKPIQYIYLL